MSEFVIQGMRELVTELQGFPDKLQRKALGAAMRASGRVIRDIAREKVPSRSGALRRSIRVSVRRDRVGYGFRARIIAGARTKKDDPFYAWMVEAGTKPHAIRGKKGLAFGGLIREGVAHPGARPRPFLGPALEEGAEAALQAMRTTLEAEIEKLGVGAIVPPGGL